MKYIVVLVKCFISHVSVLHKSECCKRYTKMSDSKGSKLRQPSKIGRPCCTVPPKPGLPPSTPRSSMGESWGMPFFVYRGSLIHVFCMANTCRMHTMFFFHAFLLMLLHGKNLFLKNYRIVRKLRI